MTGLGRSDVTSCSLIAAGDKRPFLRSIRTRESQIVNAASLARAD